MQSMIKKIFPAIGLAIIVILTSSIDAPASESPDPPKTVMVNAISGVTTVVASDTVAAGTFNVERVLCPAGTVAIGGGIDMDNVLTMQVTSSAPTFPNGDRLISRPNGTNPAPNGWQATAFNQTATPKDFKVAVICAPLTEASAVVASDTVAGGTFNVERVLCPAGDIAVGGGIDMDNVLTMRITSSAPTFSNGDRLISRPNGTNPAPNGWQATALNQTTNPKDFKVAVICAPLTEASTVVSSDTAAAGTFGVERTTCPAGDVAVGGGIDMDNVLTMQVTSSAPTFPNGDRLISRPNGTNPAPTGWQVTALNGAGTDQDFKVAAICVQLETKLFLPMLMK
jgi:hypothetical protein